jgi:hypothetical protein
MPIWLVLSILALASILAVPAILRAYSRLLRSRLPKDKAQKRASLDRVRRAEQFWFRISPFVLIAAAVVAAFFGLRSH